MFYQTDFSHGKSGSRGLAKHKKEMGDSFIYYRGGIFWVDSKRIILISVWKVCTRHTWGGACQINLK